MPMSPEGQGAPKPNLVPTLSCLPVPSGLGKGPPITGVLCSASELKGVESRDGAGN